MFISLHKYFLGITFLFFLGCKSKKPLFTLVENSQSNLLFENKIDETPEKNVMVYEYYYNGGGVAAADFNNDGLCDLYFTGNYVENKLYLNKGKLIFDDVTDISGVKGRDGWKTGATAVDINGDGWLDIYVSYSGPEKKENLYEELYINQGCKKGGIPKFIEQAKQYGLDAPFTFSTQSAFFDFDKDGDLDMFQVNHGQRFYSPFFNTSKVRNKRHPQFGNRLYRNDNGHFVDISDNAGIHGGGLNFGLGVAISDINNDGWPDIYVTNDYEEQDYIYLNTGQGSFKDVTKYSVGHLSKFSMGCDIADFNNDLLQDILVVDMLPDKLERQKLLKGADEYDKYTMMVDSGFQHQNMRNTLQLNQGNNKRGIPQFSEIGQLAGMYKTDWSWSALLADLNNDGYKDIFITNGFLRDFTNLDFLKYTYQEASEKAHANNTILPVYELIKKMPSTLLSNYIFTNNEDLTFSDNTNLWGIDKPSMSFGAVYADLDNDGDLDLVTNNTNEQVSLWENHTNEFLDNNFIKVKLTGKDKNVFAIGAKIFVTAGKSQQLQELYPTRGFQSSIDYILNFGIGNYRRNDISIKVIWPDGKISIRENVKINSLTQISEDKLAGIVDPVYIPKKSFLFQDFTINAGIKYKSEENIFVDFKTESLIPYELSKSGPFMSKGDVNNDGLEDFFIGGSSGFEGQIFIQQNDGKFHSTNNSFIAADKISEDMGSLFFDADKDGDLDLYVVSGGNEFPVGHPALADRLYINNGVGKFTKATDGELPKEYSSGSCVTAADYDKDGDLDLYIGGKIEPGKFPTTGYGGILRNDTDSKTKAIKFTIATNDVNKNLKNLGMVTDACWVDLNKDSWPDLIVAGDWMPIKIFINHRGKLELLQNAGIENSYGLWSKILVDDFDKDGDVDFIVGNAGINGQWKPTASEPIIMYADDFNNDGSIDPVICTSVDGKYYPVSSLDELAEKIPSIRKKFIYYRNYAKASIEEIFSNEQLAHAKKLMINNLQTCYFENKGNGKFAMKALPIEAQFSKVNGLLSNDYDHDGNIDILLTGNFFEYRVQYGRADASYGVLLKGDGKGNFRPLYPWQTGVYANGNIRDMIELNSRLIIISKNNDSIQVLKRAN